jgi:hypothetical protein
MPERDSILPLLIGAILSLAAHFVLLPAMAQTLRTEDGPKTRWPDLRVASLSVPPNSPAGRGLPLAFNLINSGDAATPIGKPVKVEVFLSRDTARGDDDLSLLTYEFRGPGDEPSLAPGQSLPHPQARITAPLPAGTAGDFFVIAVVDPGNEIDEGPHEGNNTVAFRITVTAADDLSRPDLVLLAATAPGGVRPGETVVVEFSIGGATGGEPVTASWLDGVFLSADAQLSADDVLLTALPGPSETLRAGQTYSRRAELRIDPPAAIADAAFLLFAADHLNRVAELDESNNVLARPIRIIRPDSPQAAADERKPHGPPDLHVPVFSAPASAMNGETLTIDFIVANRGEGAAQPTQWRDRVYLSNDDKLDGDDKLLATYEHNGAMSPGGHYAARLKGALDLPETEDGQRFLIIKTDAEDAVAETDEKNNIAVRPISINQLVIGKDKKDEDKITVAWIPYDDFRKLIAVASQAEQPALQNKADPVKGAPTPRDPSPPSPPAPQPTEASLTKKSDEAAEVQKAARQPQPTETAAPPARRIESQSPIATPAPKPVDQPKADAVAVVPVLPRPQPPADGPHQPGNPVKQPDAQTPSPQPGIPSTQTPQALPRPIAPVVDPAAPIAKPGSTDSEARVPAKSDATATAAKPVQQPRAEAPVPVPGDPTRLARADAPPSPTGEPTKLIPGQSPEPAKEGRPTTSPVQKGADQPQPKPAPSADDAAKAAPKAADEKTVKPVPRSTPSNPTSAPRDDSEVPPSILEDKPFNVEPGGVITRPGIQIVAATPDITTPSWLVSGPSAVNPVARITFSREGKVIAVDLLRSTGHANLDSPIKASFFNFRAKGEALKRVRESFSIEVRLLLKNERD